MQAAPPVVSEQFMLRVHPAGNSGKTLSARKKIHERNLGVNSPWSMLKRANLHADWESLHRQLNCRIDVEQLEICKLKRNVIKFSSSHKLKNSFSSNSALIENVI